MTTQHQTPPSDEHASTADASDDARGINTGVAPRRPAGTRPKRWLTVTAALALAALLLGVLAWRSLNPAALEKSIVTAVMEGTGLELRIEDDVALSLFPLSLELGRVELDNVPGFAQPYLLRSDSLGVHIKLLPLFRKQIDMQAVSIRGLELNLERDRYGRTNWDTLLSRSTRRGTPPAAALAIGGVSIRDATLRFEDRQALIAYTLDDLAVTTGALTTGEPADLRVSFGFRSERQSSFEPLSIDGEASVTGKLDLDLGARSARVTELELLATARGDVLTDGEARLSLAGAVEYALATRTLAFEALSIAADGLQLFGVGSDARLESPSGSLDLHTGLIQLEALRLQSDLRGPVVPGGAISVALSGNLAVNPATRVLVAKNLRIDVPDLTWSDTAFRVAFAGDANADLASHTLAIPNLDLKTTVSNPRFFERPIDTRLRAALEADVWRGGVVLRDVRFDALDVRVLGDVGVMDPLRRSALSGSIRIEPFNPRDLLQRLGYGLLDTRDAKALTSAKLAARIVGTQDAVELRELMLDVDDTQLSGHIGVRRFGGPTLYADLHADHIDADRYRCAACAGTGTAGATLAAAGAIAALPIAALRALDVSTRLRVGRLHAAGLTFRAMDIGLRGDQGLVELKPFSGELYDGRYDGYATIDTRGDATTLSLTEQLNGLNVGALLRARGVEPHTPLADTTADAELRLEATSDVSGERLEIHSLSFDGALNGKTPEQDTFRVGLHTRGTLSVPDARVDLEDMTLALGELNAVGRLSIQDTDADLRFTGKLNVGAFDPRRLVASLGLPALSTADPKAFGSLALSTRFDATATALRLDDLAITLDDTRATGHIDITRLGMPPALRFDLSVGNVDANRYLPAPGASAQAGAPPGVWPLAALRALDVDGVITAKQMRLTDVKLSNVKLRVTARDGELRVAPPEPGGQAGLERETNATCSHPEAPACLRRDALAAEPMAPGSAHASTSAIQREARSAL